MSKTSPKNGKRDISSIMRKVSSTDTSPEVALRNALADRGVNLIKNGGDGLPGKPDIVLAEETQHKKSSAETAKNKASGGDFFERIFETVGGV